MKTLRLIILFIELLVITFVFNEFYFKHQITYYTTNWTPIKANNTKYCAIKGPSKSINSNDWNIKIEYSYEHNGRKYYGNRIVFPEGDFFSNEFKIEFEKRIANQKAIQVFIDPKNPNESIVIKSLNDSCNIPRVFLKLFIILFLTYMFSFGFSIRYNLLEKRVSVNKN